ncbi:MAG TPA: hypothetical protein VIK18_12480 [Pirellulales bacterium]
MGTPKWSRLLCVVLALGCVAAVDVLSARRARIAHMSPEQKQTLLENQQRLEQLEPDEQRRLRAFAAALEQDPEADRLRAIMLRYAAWVRQLPMEKRSELLQLSGDARLARIKQFISQESRWAAQRLSPQDEQVVAAWIEHRALEVLPPEQRTRLEQAPAAERRRMLARLVWQRSQQTGIGHGVGFRPPDLRVLSEKLSPAARQRLIQAVEAHRGSELVGDWIRQSLGSAYGSSRGGMPSRGGGDFRRFFPREAGDRPPPSSKDSGRGPRRPPAQSRPPSDDPPLNQPPRP